jgi:hypothetical protein
MYRNDWSDFNLPIRFWKRTQKYVSHMERNNSCWSFVHMCNLTPLFSLGQWRNRAIMATPEQKAFCVLQFVKHESIVSVQRAFRWHSTAIPCLPVSIDAGVCRFRQRGAFVKKKVQDCRVLITVWQELDYRLYMCRVIKDAYFEHFWACVLNLYNSCFIITSVYNSVHHTCEYNQLPNRSNHFDTHFIWYNQIGSVCIT